MEIAGWFHTNEREGAVMLRFLVYFRYGMTFHGPRIGDHVASEKAAFEDRVLGANAPAKPPLAPVS